MTLSPRPAVLTLLLACMTLAACSPKSADDDAPASPSDAAAVQPPVAQVPQPEQAPAEVKKPKLRSLDTATPEERLELFPYLKPSLNFREILSPFLKDAQVQYSQYYEELIIRDFFQDQRNGVFLDVGCYHPIYISTTYYLEHHLGWSGYAIDAVAQHGKKWQTERPNSKFFAYAVTDHDGDTITFHVLGGTSSLSEAQAETFGGTSRAIEVPTITLNTLLDREGVKNIDFMSIDIEGAEPGAFAGFDIQRFKPRLVVVEQAPGEKNEKMAAYFEKNNYVRIEKYLAVDKLNWYFTPKTPE